MGYNHAVGAARIWILCGTVTLAEFCFAPSLLQAQLSVPFHASFEQGSIGVAPYEQPHPARYRLLFGYGGNGGLSSYTPSTFIGNASYQLGARVLSAGFVTSTNVTQILPRRTYSELDVMYGIAFESALPHYEGPSDNFHSSLAAGISLDSYSERWRTYGRRMFPSQYPPTTFQYSVGLPIQFQAIYEPLEYAGIGVGIGAILFCNISNFAPSYGGAVAIEAKY